MGLGIKRRHRSAASELGRRDAHPWRRRRRPAGDQQKMRCSFPETEISRVGLLQFGELIRQLRIDMKGCRIPARIRQKPIMKNVESAQILDVELTSKAVRQLVRGEEMEKAVQ